MYRPFGVWQLMPAPDEFSVIFFMQYSSVGNKLWIKQWEGLRITDFPTLLHEALWTNSFSMLFQLFLDDSKMKNFTSCFKGKCPFSYISNWNHVQNWTLCNEIDISWTKNAYLLTFFKSLPLDSNKFYLHFISGFKLDFVHWFVRFISVYWVIWYFEINSMFSLPQKNNSWPFSSKG